MSFALFSVCYILYCVLVNLVFMYYPQRKSEVYWPPRPGDSVHHHPYTVTCSGLDVLSNYTIRVLAVNKQVCNVTTHDCLAL